MAKKQQRTRVPKKAKNVQPRAKKAKKKAAKVQPRAKKKAAAKKSLSKQIKAKPAARGAAPKRASMPAVASRASVAAAPGVAPNILGSDAATDIVTQCAQGQDPDTATVGDVGDSRIFQQCVQGGVSDAEFDCVPFPCTPETPLSLVITTIAKSPHK
jgi:hypothetical protein